MQKRKIKACYIYSVGNITWNNFLSWFYKKEKKKICEQINVWLIKTYKLKLKPYNCIMKLKNDQG